MTWEAFLELVTRAPGLPCVTDVHSCDLTEDLAAIFIMLRLAGGELAVLEIPLSEIAQRATVHDVGEGVTE